MPWKYLLEMSLWAERERLGAVLSKLLSSALGSKEFISCAVCRRGKTVVFFFLYFLCFCFPLLIFLMCSSEARVWWILECRRRRGEGGREGGREEKGRVLGQADRDVSTASVILWRLRERQKKKKSWEGAGRLKDQRLGDSRSRDHPNNSSRGCWEGREGWGGGGGSGGRDGGWGVWGVKPEGEADLQLHIIADS